jgi:hypothetical protein
MTTYDLGELHGGQFYQYANSAGQSYYYDKIGKTTSFAIPQGYEDSQLVCLPFNTIIQV